MHGRRCAKNRFWILTREGQRRSSKVWRSCATSPSSRSCASSSHSRTSASTPSTPSGPCMEADTAPLRRSATRSCHSSGLRARRASARRTAPRGSKRSFEEASSTTLRAWGQPGGTPPPPQPECQESQPCCDAVSCLSLPLG